MGEMKKNVHEGHRARMRARFFAESDFDGFTEHEILEFVIGYLQPRKNMNETAHRLMDKFGSLSRVFDARPEELMQVEGVGPLMAAFIKTQCALLRVYMQEKYSVISEQSFEEDLTRYIDTLFLGYTSERVFMISLNNANRILHKRMLCEGACNRVSIDINEIIREAILVNASSVILAHNHPTGIAVASNEDLEVTRLVEEALSLINVRLLDHIIVAGGRHISIGADSRFRIKKFMKPKK